MTQSQGVCKDRHVIPEGGYYCYCGAVTSEAVKPTAPGVYLLERTRQRTVPIVVGYFDEGHSLQYAQIDPMGMMLRMIPEDELEGGTWICVWR